MSMKTKFKRKELILIIHIFPLYYNYNLLYISRSAEFYSNIETYLQSHSEAFDYTRIFIVIIANNIRVNNSWFPCPAIKGNSVTNNKSKELENKLLRSQLTSDSLIVLTMQ